MTRMTLMSSLICFIRVICGYSSLTCVKRVGYVMIAAMETVIFSPDLLRSE